MRLKWGEERELWLMKPKGKVVRLCRALYSRNPAPILNEMEHDRMVLSSSRPVF